MESGILNEIHERIVKNFLDTIILATLKEPNKPIGGYDVVKFLHNKFGMLISSSTVYYLLYSMERDGFIRGMLSSRKRVYTLTDKGEKRIKAFLEAKQKILGLIVNLFSCLEG